MAVFPIDIPPLRDRKEDIPLLAKAFLDQLNDENGTAFSWTPAQLKELQSYEWPGNVREIRHAIHRAFIMSDPQTSDIILPDNLESPFSRVNNQTADKPVSAGQTIEEVEKELIHATLDKVQGNKTLAAQIDLRKGMTSDNQTEQLNKLVHDARAPLNRISMNAELIKLVLENDMPKEKALDALDKIINNCQQCSESLQKIIDSQ